MLVGQRHGAQLLLVLILPGLGLRVPNVITNTVNSWWVETLRCGGGHEEWLPHCEPDPCPKRVPLPPLNFGFLRVSDFVEYHTKPCRHIPLSIWRQAHFRPDLSRKMPGDGADTIAFELRLPTHPSFGWFLLSLFGKLVEKLSFGERNAGFSSVSTRASSGDVDEHIGVLCASSMLAAGSPLGHFANYSLKTLLFDPHPQAFLASFEKEYLSPLCFRWAVPFRYKLHSCIFGVMADIAALGTTPYLGEPAILNHSSPVHCTYFEDAARYLASLPLGLSHADLEAAINIAQDMSLLCLEHAPSFPSGLHRRATFLLDAANLYQRLRHFGGSKAVGPDPFGPSGRGVEGFQLPICGAAAFAVTRLNLVHGQVHAFLLGSTVVNRVVELALFLAETEEGCVPMVDAVSCLSMPHAALLDWHCDFGLPGEKDPATVLSYYGTELIVRCPLPDEFDSSSSTISLSLEPANPSVEAAGWALRGMSFCPGQGEHRPRRRLALCGQPMYSLKGREDELLQWVEYHSSELGVDTFFLYDNDGSAAATLRPFLAANSVRYFPRWPAEFGRHYEAIHVSGGRVVRQQDGNLTRFPSGLSTHAETHCLFHTRFNYDYAIFVHSVDAYVLWQEGRAGLQGFLDELPVAARRQLAGVQISYQAVGGPPVLGTRLVIERFQYRGPGTNLVWTMDLKDVKVDTGLDAAQPLVVPENVVAVVGSHWARGRPGTIHVQPSVSEARIHHYLDLLSPRCQLCEEPEFGMREPARRLRRRLASKGLLGMAVDEDPFPVEWY